VSARLRIGTLAAAALAALLAGTSARAQTNTGTTIGSFMEIEPVARIAAMGNAGVSAYDGLSSLYYNPAAAAKSDQLEALFTHSAWIADISYDYAALAVPLGKWGTGFTAITSLNSGEIDVRTVEQPQGTGERYSVSDIAIAVGFARQISQRFAAGGQVTFMQETIWHSSAATATFSIGTLFRVSDNGLRIGSSLSNFGTRAAFDGRDLRFTYDADPSTNGDNSTLPASKFTDAFAVPVTFRVGLAQPVRLPGQQKLMFEADAFHPNDNSESVSVGGEYSLADRVAVRAGWQNLFLQDSEVGLTAGAGVMGRLDDWKYRIDYAWADQGRLGHSHRLTLDFGF
jgi:hypothetical protein